MDEEYNAGNAIFVMVKSGNVKKSVEKNRANLRIDTDRALINEVFRYGRSTFHRCKL
jgi:hypothetical protein